MAAVDPELTRLRTYLATEGHRLYLGLGTGGLALAEREQAALVLGPPRSGKTTTLAIPNVLAAPGAVVSTSTKPDVLAATWAARSRIGRCWLLDPTGTVDAPEAVTRIRWSPIDACGTWDGTLVVARALVRAARPTDRTNESAHWAERAEALLSSLLHAAALDGRPGHSPMEAVVGWVLRQDLDRASAVLRGREAHLAADVLLGIAATDSRERSGIWSSAAGVLAAYRSQAALDTARDPNFDPSRLVDSCDTVYVCAPGRHQDLVAPIVVTFVDQVRAGAYRASAAGRGRSPVTAVLDELANVAPMPDLPAMISEGGGQGILTLA